MRKESYSLAYILENVCEYYKVRPVYVKGNERTDELVKARHTYFYLARKLTTRTHDRIAQEVNRHYATSIHGFRKLTVQIEFYPELKNEINAIENMIITPKHIVGEVNLLQIAKTNEKR